MKCLDRLNNRDGGHGHTGFSSSTLLCPHSPSFAQALPLGTAHITHITPSHTDRALERTLIPLIPRSTLSVLLSSNDSHCLRGSLAQPFDTLVAFDVDNSRSFTTHILLPLRNSINDVPSHKHLDCQILHTALTLITSNINNARPRSTFPLRPPVRLLYLCRLAHEKQASSW